MSKTQGESQDLVRLDPQALIRTAVESGAGIETLERLVALAKDVRAQQAREAWYHAMAEFQRTCPAILKTATAKIATRSGAGYGYKYAPLDEITSTILPIMGPLGLSISWRTPKMDAQGVVAVCRVSHELGHFEESGEVAVPVVQGDGSGASAPQRVGIAISYAKRYALLSAIGLAPEDDPDAHDPGPAVQPPRRASEAAKSTPDTIEGLIWTGIITAVDEKKSKAGKTFWLVTGSFEGASMTFSTFSESLMREAIGRMGASVESEIAYTQKTVGNQSFNNIDAIRDAEIAF